MIGIAIWAFSFWWAFGPNDYHLTTLLHEADVLEHRLLPLDELANSVSPLWIVAHGRSEWPPFLFVDEQDWDRQTGLGFLFGTERLLPNLMAPRLFVSRKYLVGGELARGFRRLEPLAIDESNALFRALMEIHLSRVADRRPSIANFVEQRSHELMTEVPEGARRAAYLHAQADYSAHLLSVGHEIGRHQRRKKSGALCGLLGHPGTLFGFWHRAVTAGSYPGLYFRSAESGARSTQMLHLTRGDWRMTQASLEAQDKSWMANAILGTGWSGDPTEDFVILCEPSAREEPAAKP